MDPELFDLLKTDEGTAALAKLAYREREVIKLRYGLGDYNAYTQEQVGRIFRVRTDRVQKIEGSALKKLRAWYDSRGGKSE
jgi:RNA polymerase primary sigma factor